MKSVFVVSAIAALAAAAPVEKRTPPNIPSTSSANTLLAGLTVKAQGSQDGYSRDLFPHWITISGTCNTRETVLKRDGTSVVTDSACAATSGTWKSPYDGATWTAASDVDIDHVVPLSNAWKVRRVTRESCTHKLILCSLELQPGPPPSARHLPTTSPTPSSPL